MEHRRRRTDLLPASAELPLDPLARSRAACDALADAGFAAACGLQVARDEFSQALLCAGTGRIDKVVEVARGVADEAARSGRALSMLDADDSGMGLRWRFGAVPCGELREGNVVLVVADPALTQREAQAIAAWASPPATHSELERPAQPATDGRMGDDIARDLAAEFGADVVVFGLFAQAGMLLNMHVRSGAVLRSWRVPVDTVWGEAARHAAAFVLGDLHLHPGAEMLASLGLNSAAIVGIDNGKGVPVGSVGLAGTGELDVHIAQLLLERAPILGPQLMRLHEATSVPRADANGGVELRGFAARVGCRRFAMYRRDGASLRMVAAHAQDGSVLVSPPDEFEEQLVGWAAERGIAVASDDAAAIMLGDDTVLYAQDAQKVPMECLRLALQDLRADPYGRAA